MISTTPDAHPRNHTVSGVLREFRTDDARYEAIARRDPRAEGEFVFAVRTTGVYCRPTCGARLARRENVEFHRTGAEARGAGFRACLRCRPDEDLSQGKHAAAVAKACARLVKDGASTDLARLAGSAGLSGAQFRRVFVEQTGMTPKAYAMAGRAKRVREELPRRARVTSAIYGAGFGSSGRFYEQATRILGMTATQYRDRGAGAKIVFAARRCDLGVLVVGATAKGVCFLALGDDRDGLITELQSRFSEAECIRGDGDFDALVARVVEFVEHPARGLDLPLDIRGTAFQHRVWRELQRIPTGETRSYAEIAKAIGSPGSSRAVAKACASNSVAVAIPCHRVVRADSSLSGYRWGVERKAALLERERSPVR